MRAWRLAALLMLLGCRFAAPALSSEDYAIYSVVLEHFSTRTGNPRFALIRDILDPASVKPSPRGCGAPQITRSSARPANDERLDERKLKVSRPYRLLTKEQAGQWSMKRFAPQVPTDPPAPEPPDPDPGSNDLVQLSGVVYSADHSVAAV